MSGLPGGTRSPAGGRKSIQPDSTAKTNSIEVDIERVCVSHGDPRVGRGALGRGRRDGYDSSDSHR